MDVIAGNLQRVMEAMGKAAVKSGRKPEAVRLMAVSKMVDADRIRQALAAGVRCLGENRVQEAQSKKTRLAGLDFEYHLIGPLQKNKVNRAVAIFDWIQTVDSLDLAMRIDRSAARARRVVPVLVQVNVGRESQKAGIREEQLEELARRLVDLEHISVEGLMAIPPYLEDGNAVRPYFRRLRRLSHRLAGLHLPTVSMKILSMGMSHDFPVAIEEGSTLVRVGTAIFGRRPAA
jgi:pyridoxal phosphate enzyme (YggS family)